MAQSTHVLSSFINNVELSDKDSCSDVYARFLKDKKNVGMIMPGESMMCTLFAFEHTTDIVSAEVDMSTVRAVGPNAAEGGGEKEEVAVAEDKKGRKLWGWGKKHIEESEGSGLTDGEAHTAQFDQTDFDEKYVAAFKEMITDEKEGRIMDTDREYITKIASNKLWPQREQDMFVGLRVDGCDQNRTWFQGSITKLFKKSTSVLRKELKR